MPDKEEELHYDTEELAEYFAGDMPVDEAAVLEAHLGGCQHCRAEALRISERSAAWFTWTPEAHQAAAAAASQTLPRRSLWTYVWQGLAVAGAAATLILIVINLQRGHLLEQISQRLATADQTAASATERTRQLEKEVADLRGRIAQRPEGPSRPGTPKGRGVMETPVKIADARPVVSLETGTLGATTPKTQVLTVNAAIPSVRIRITLPELSANAIIDASLSGGDWHTEKRGLTIQFEGDTRYVILIMTQEEIRRVLNRPTQLILTNRGHANIGAVILTVRLQ